MGLGKVLEGFIVITVGVNLAPTVANQVAGATANANITNNAGVSTMLNLTVLFFAIGIMTSGIGIGVGGLQEIGLL